MVRGQCTQILMENMKLDSDWDNARTSYDTIKLIELIEKNTLAQTLDQYPFTTVYEQEVEFYSYHKKNLTGDQ